MQIFSVDHAYRCGEIYVLYCSQQQHMRDEANDPSRCSGGSLGNQLFTNKLQARSDKHCVEAFESTSLRTSTCDDVGAFENPRILALDMDTIRSQKCLWASFRWKKGVWKP